MNKTELIAAEEIKRYYGSVRQVGNTTRMLEGADKHTIIVAHSSEHARALAEKSGAIGLSLHKISQHGLRGYNKPLVLDNCATYVLLDALLKKIDELKKDKERLDAAEKMRLCLVSEPNGQWTYHNPSDNAHPTIRAAIDAALKEKASCEHS